MSRVFLFILLIGATIAAAQNSSPSPPSCEVGELYDKCPNSCYEPVCGDKGMQLCAGIISCDPPKCVCDRSKEYARDPSSGKCVKRDLCPSWTLNPCMTVKCSAGMVCEAKDGKAGCVKAPTIEPYPVTLNACAATLCTVGSVCVEEGGVARCVAPQGGNNNCSSTFEEWKQCATCEPSCDNRTPMCNKMCQPSRCMCRRGFFRSSDGQCVTENDCDVAAMTPTPLTCSRANEEYRECASACEPTCREKDQEKMCIAMCKPPACQCKQGFYRNDNGDCVSAGQCTVSITPRPTSPQCKKNEAFSSCSSMCEPQCGQYKPIACILMCGPPKCQCISGFYRNSKGNCVTREECEKSPNPSTPGHPACKRNEIFAECSSVCIPKCGEYEVRPCMAMCGAPKCQCDRGFYTDNKGDCVSREECETQALTPKTPSQSDCLPNEKFRECSSQCEEKCGEVLTRACPASCGPPKCQCDDGFLKNEAGECVLKSECESRAPRSQSDCGPNMTFRNCSSPCQSKCGDYVAKPCIVMCGPPKCECNAGFYFNRVGDCVNRSDCDLDESSPITCANIDCRSGMVCKMKNGEPTCVNADALTCNTVKCAGGHRCEISPEGTPTCIPMITCANVRCAGPCKDTPNGPQCGPRPLILPISVGPTSSPGCPSNEEIRNCTNKCNEPFCGDENYARRCSLVCLTPECECVDGFVRDGERGCVRREDCTKKDETQEAVSPCARKNCGIAGRCVEERGRAVCLPLFDHKSVAPSIPPSPPTAAHSPRSFPSLPDSCDKVKCLDGGTCAMEEVKCRSGPCKPVPKCRGGSLTVAPSEDTAVSSRYGSVYQPFADNCDQLKCKWGEECTMERIPCFAPPCKKGAICRPANRICHKKHEVWDQCFHGCGETCQNRNPSCTEQCGPGGCICDTFYVRDEESGECVRLENCPLTRDVPIEKPRALTIDSFVSSPSSFPVPPQTCEGFDCPVGQMCTLPQMACPVPPCTPRPMCVHDPSFLPGDEIVPSCEGHSCPTGQMCQLIQVTCIRAPCYPIPDCVPVTVPPTCNLPCPYGETCVLETVLCKKAPCPQRPSCRLLQVDPIPQTCAAVSCLLGETCVEEPLPCLVAPCPIRAICRPATKSCEKQNEVWSQCFTECESTCQKRNKMCTMRCGPGGCQCASGYIRNERNGECILERECPLDDESMICPEEECPPVDTSKTCNENEMYDRCFHDCDPTCYQPIPFCTKQCGPGGCRCISGFVRDEKTNKCVHQSTCNMGAY